MANIFFRPLFWIGTCFLLACLGAGYVFWMGVSEIAEALSTDTDAEVVEKTVNGKVEFDLTYGKDVTGLTEFVVQDPEGRELWKLEGPRSEPVSRVVYGVVPRGHGWKQKFPQDDQKPKDIRGKRVKVKAKYRYNIAFGPGHQSTQAEFVIQK